eukprot:Nk52_evm7s254 gene=Nk52_evmTU7s254
MLRSHFVQIVLALCVLTLLIASCSVAGEKYVASIVDHTWTSTSPGTISSLRVHDKGGLVLGSNEDRKVTHAVHVEGSCDLSPSVYGKIVRYASEEIYSRNQVHTDFLATPVSGGDMVLEAHSYASGESKKAVDVFTDEYYFIGKDMRMNNIDLYVHSGGVHMRDVVASSLHAKSISGDVNIGHMPTLNHVDVSSTSGDVYMDSSSLSGKVSTTSGNIHITNSVLNTGGDITISGVSSGITVFLDCRRSCGNVRVSSTSGDVNLIIGQVNGKSWSASSVSGTVRINGRKNSGGSFFGSRSRSGRVNGGGSTSVHVSTVSGDVNLRFSNRAARIGEMLSKDCSVNSPPLVLSQSSIQSMFRTSNSVMRGFSVFRFAVGAIIMGALLYFFWKCIRCCCCCVSDSKVQYGKVEESNYYHEGYRSNNSGPSYAAPQIGPYGTTPSNGNGSYGSIPMNSSIYSPNVTNPASTSNVPVGYSNQSGVVGAPSYFQCGNGVPTQTMAAGFTKDVQRNGNSYCIPSASAPPLFPSNNSSIY